MKFLNQAFLFFLLVSPIDSFTQNSDYPILDSLLKVAGSYTYVDPNTADSLYRMTLQKSSEVDYDRGIALSYKGLGIVADIQFEHEISLSLYSKAFDIFINMDDSLEAYKVSANKGIIYRKNGKHEIAKTFFTEAMGVFDRHDFPIGVIICKQNWAIAEFDLGHYEEALPVFIELRKEMEVMGGDVTGLIGSIGNCYFQLMRLEEALPYQVEAYYSAKVKNNQQDMLMYGVALGQNYRRQGDFEKSITINKELLPIARDHQDIHAESRLEWSLCLAYEVKGDYQRALWAHIKYLKLKDSMNHSDFSLKLSNLEAVQKNEKAEQEIVLLSEKEKLSDAKAKHDRIVQWGTTGIGVLFLVVSVVFFIQNKKRKALNYELEIKNHQIEEQHQEISDSINYAKQIQGALLSAEDEWKKITNEHFVYFQPKDVVSGDYFWAHHVDDKNLSIWVAADCTGHGVPGAFMSMLGIGFLNEIVVEGKEYRPNHILNKLRHKIIQALENTNLDKQRKDGMDMAICVWDKKADILNFTGANNPLYIIRETADADIELVKDENETMSLLELKPDKMPVGAFVGEPKDFSVSEFKLQKGDKIYSFSDGYPDQFGGEKGKKYKYKQFRKLLLDICKDPLNEQHRKIAEEFDRWKGDFEQLDDICVIGVKV